MPYLEFFTSKVDRNSPDDIYSFTLSLYSIFLYFSLYLIFLNSKLMDHTSISSLIVLAWGFLIRFVLKLIKECIYNLSCIIYNNYSSIRYTWNTYSVLGHHRIAGLWENPLTDLGSRRWSYWQQIKIMLCRKSAKTGANPRFYS